jgi:hypothetical protein
MGSEEETLEGLIRVLEDIKTTRITVDRKKILPFLFEYACQTIEYDGLEAKDFSSEIEGIMFCKLETMVEKQMEENYLARGTQKLHIPEISLIPFLVDQAHAVPFNPSDEYKFSKKEIAKNNKKTASIIGNPQIEIAYLKLAETGVKFDRNQLEEWCFEAASLDLEKEGKQKIQSNYDQQILRQLTAILLKTDTLPEKERTKLYLAPLEDYHSIAFCEVESQE